MAQDPTHHDRFRSVYTRTDYIVNSDMSIPYALARSFVFLAQDEGARRTGVPAVERRSLPTALALKGPAIPQRMKR